MRSFSVKISSLESENRKLVAEVERLKTLLMSNEGLSKKVQEECDLLRRRHHDDMRQIVESHEAKIQELTNEFTSKISELDLANQKHVCTIESLSVALTDQTDEVRYQISTQEINYCRLARESILCFCFEFLSNM